MTVDYNQDSAPVSYKCDICIVGTGAAALALLTTLYDSPYQVVVVEAGGETITDKNQNLYQVLAPYHPFPGAIEGRFRVFGGSTLKWGGQALPLDTIDFAQRSWVPFSGWPIPYQEVAKYYPAVDNFLDVEATDYETDMYTLLRKKRLPESELRFRFSKWSPKPNLREKFRKRITQSKNIVLVQNASVISVNLVENGDAVENLTISNFQHKKGHIQAKRYVLACGGLETPRLLLASNRQNQKGVGNEYDVVGRFLQDHPNAYIGSITNANSRTQQYFNYFYLRRTRCLPRFLLSEELQTKHHLLNASASILFFPQDDGPYAQALAIYRKHARGNLEWKDISALFRVGAQAGQLISPVASLLLHNKVFTPNPAIKLNLMMEMPPQWHNRVALSATKKDALGLPVASVEWQFSEQVRHTLTTCATLFADYFPGLGLGDLHLEEWITSGDWASHLKDAYHHIGTTRMANTPAKGVVNTNCQVFGVSNLYVAGSSVFPTSGHSNPTATLIALAFRLAEHLKISLA